MNFLTSLGSLRVGKRKGIIFLLYRRELVTDCMQSCPYSMGIPLVSYDVCRVDCFQIMYFSYPDVFNDVAWLDSKLNNVTVGKRGWKRL